MQIEAYIENPIIKNSDDFRNLEARIKEADSMIYSLKVMPRKIVIERFTTRSFRYTDKPTVEWIISKILYMKNKNL